MMTPGPASWWRVPGLRRQADDFAAQRHLRVDDAAEAQLRDLPRRQLDRRKLAAGALEARDDRRAGLARVEGDQATGDHAVPGDRVGLHRDAQPALPADEPRRLVHLIELQRRRPGARQVLRPLVLWPGPELVAAVVLPRELIDRLGRLVGVDRLARIVLRRRLGLDVFAEARRAVVGIGPEQVVGVGQTKAHDPPDRRRDDQAGRAVVNPQRIGIVARVKVRLLERDVLGRFLLFFLVFGAAADGGEDEQTDDDDAERISRA
jgi:hypothetical protein